MQLPKLSVVIPAHNEEGCIKATVESLFTTLEKENIPHEICVINDNSSDQTKNILNEIQKKISTLAIHDNSPPNGFGFAVRCGLEKAIGDVLCIFMADESDSPQDLVKFYKTLNEKQVDCVFGSRFIKGGKTIDYPAPKLVLNRLANLFIQILFKLSYNDTTNAFKMFRREVIEGLKPFLSHHFNLTVELPLKAIVRGYTFAVVPNSWTNRKAGVSKLKIKEMGSRYLFIVLYCFIEKLFSAGDYYRRDKLKARSKNS